MAKEVGTDQRETCGQGKEVVHRAMRNPWRIKKLERYNIISFLKYWAAT